MNTFSYKIYLRESITNAKGENPVYVCFIFNRKSTQFSLSISVLPQNWNNSQISIKKTDIQHIKKNIILERAKKRLSEISLDMTVTEKILEFNEIIEYVRNETPKVNFYDYALQRIETMNIELVTKKCYKSKISKLKQFRKELNFNEISPEFIRAYTNFAINEKGNKPISWNKDLEILNRFCKWALEDGKIKENPFKNIKIKRDFEGTREFLNENELKRLEELYLNTSDKYLKNTLLNFLFSCFTGIRFGDIKRLQWSNLVQKTVKGEDLTFLEFTPKKTKNSSGIKVSIPLLRQAKELLPENRTVSKFIFRVLTNQPTNRRLKEIANLAEISKNLSFNCARHTFATIALNKDVDIYVLRDFLGHKKITTTQRYAKLLPDYKVSEMDKWR